jgi:hypothetical protein
VVWNHGKGSTIIAASEPVKFGRWNHLAVTYDADTRRLALYVNGEPAATAAEVRSTSFKTISVGRRESAKEFQLIGDVDDVVVYDTALTQEEIVILDAGQKLERRPVLHWDFESVKRHEVTDVTGRHQGRFVGIKADSHVNEDGFNGHGLSLRNALALNQADQERLDLARARLNVIDAQIPESIKVMTAQAGTPVDLPVHIRGSHTNPGKDVVRRTTPRVFDSHLPPITVDRQSNGRVELAEWIAHSENPLTARVMVNRIWQHHFGVGLVRTPSNFGRRGESPSHPQLLDWLAKEFVKNGWSIKHMHRLIMTSAAYRRSSDRHAAATETDADNRLLARFPIRRLEAEAIRDSLLRVSGELEPGSPGSLMDSPNMKRVAMTPVDPVYDSRRRGVYLPMIRVRGYEMFSIFDVSDNGQHVAARPQTMVAQQALFLLNNPFVIERAKAVAARISSRNQADAANINWLHRLMFGRNASAVESKLLNAHLQSLRKSQSEADAWQHLVHSLICSNEFIHLR